MLYRIESQGHHVLTFSLRGNNGGIFNAAKQLADIIGCRIHIVQEGVSVAVYDATDGMGNKIRDGEVEILKGMAVDGEIVWRRTATRLFVEHYSFAI